MHPAYFQPQKHQGHHRQLDLQGPFLDCCVSPISHCTLQHTYEMDCLPPLQNACIGPETHHLLHKDRHRFPTKIANVCIPKSMSSPPPCGTTKTARASSLTPECLRNAQMLHLRARTRCDRQQTLAASVQLTGSLWAIDGNNSKFWSGSFIAL